MREPAGLALLLLLSTGCPSPPDISGELEDYGDQLSSVFTLTCDCPADLGYASGSECSDDLGVVGPERRGCMANALEGYEDDAEPFLDCANAALVNYVLCLEDNLADGCVEGEYFVCADAFDGELAQCPALPAMVLDQFLACSSS